MSKTDKTRPWQVQANDDLVAVHDHSNGECNLPTREQWIEFKMIRRWSRSDCTWQPRNWGTFKGFRRYKSDGYYTKGCKQRALARIDWKKEV